MSPAGFTPMPGDRSPPATSRTPKTYRLRPIYFTLTQLNCSSFNKIYWPIQLSFCNIILYKISAVAEMGDRGHNTHGPKIEGLLCPLCGRWDPVWCNVAWAEVYFCTKRRHHPSSHLATIDIGQKSDGVGVPFFLEVAGSTSNRRTQCRVGRGLSP